MRHRPLLALTFALAALSLGSGCASHCHATAHLTATPTPSEINPRDFTPFEMVIFRPPVAGPERPVLLLHEIPGFNECTAAFAANLAREGFTVYAPVMVGRALEPGMWARWRNQLWVTFGPGWPMFSRGESPAVLPRLRTVLQQIHARHGDAHIGVIGMCMTGTLPLALGADPNVAIAAICQPALPYHWTDAHRRDLGLAPVDRDAGVRRIKADHLRVLGYRFESDTISPRERMIELAALLGDNFELDAIGRNEHPANDHATFTFSYDDTVGSPTQVRFQRLVTAFATEIDRRR